MKEDKRDYWLAFAQACGNLSQTAVKKIFAGYLDKWMNSETMQKFFKSKFMYAVNQKIRGVTKKEYVWSVNNKPVTFRYGGRKITVTGIAKGNVDVDRTGIHPLRLNCSNGMVFTFDKVKVKDGSSFLGYLEVISEVLNSIFGSAVEWGFESMMGAEDAALDNILSFAFDPLELDPSVCPGIGTLLVFIDMKKVFADVNSIPFNLIFNSLFGILNLRDMDIKWQDLFDLPSRIWKQIMSNTAESVKAFAKMWQYLATGEGGEQVDWSIFDESENYTK